MPIDYDRAYLRIKLNTEQHSVAEVATLLQVVDNLVSAPVWAGILDREFADRDESFAQAREILGSSADLPKAKRRFYPGFSRNFAYGRLADGFRDSELLEEPAGSNEPLDIGVQVGLNYWLKRVVRDADPNLYKRLFDAPGVSRLEHHSPLLLEVCVLLGATVAGVVLLTYGLLRAAAVSNRKEIENRIRRAEATSKEQEALQREIQTEMLSEVRDAIREQRKDDDFAVPESAVAAAVAIASPSVAELNSNPLIKNMTFGASFKVGE